MECERMRTKTSLLTNLLSSITLCLTRQLGMIRLARQSNIFVSLTKYSTALSHNSNSVSMIFKIWRATSYSSTLSSSFILEIVSTKLSKIPFSMSQMFMRQYFSQIASSAGSSDISSCKNSMHLQLISELGWLSIFKMGRRILDQMRMGMCYCEAYCRSVRIWSISYQGWQNFMGYQGYFMRREMFVSQREFRRYCHQVRVQRERVVGPSSFIFYNSLQQGEDRRQVGYKVRETIERGKLFSAEKSGNPIVSKFIQGEKSKRGQLDAKYQ